ncbi:MAG: hypothetical protein AABX08_02855 [Nanoarchaeota archaeon]
MPFITININSKQIEPLIDTGFNGALLLPLRKIHALNLKRIGFTEYAMADGSIVAAEMFSAEIEWLNKKRRVGVIGSHSDFMLLGMELLKNAITTLKPSGGLLNIESDETNS